MSSSSSMTPSEYIGHHLINYSAPQGYSQTSMFDFSFINLDTLVIAIVLGVLGCVCLRYAAQKVTSGVPGRFQAAIELLYEFVDNNCREMVHNPASRRLIAPLGLAVFVWIIFMNAMDLLPVDLLPWSWQHLLENEEAALRVVPTADLNTAMALALSVLILCIWYSIKIKGWKGWTHELLSVPFGNKIWVAIPNLLMNLLEFVSKTLSHGMRLWGNMYAGEIVFMVIALLGGAWNTSNSLVMNLGLFFVQIVLGSAWVIFHILIITLQAYLFMVLAFVYLGQAHSSH